MNRRVAPLGLVLALMWPAGAMGQANPWTAAVRSDLDRYGAPLRQEHYNLQGDAITGWLQVTKTRDNWVAVKPGLAYAVLGVCDQDCADIDLAVYDENGTALGQDFEKDNHPVIRFTPRGDSIMVHVYMAVCSVEPCSYGVGVFAFDSTPPRDTAGTRVPRPAPVGDAQRWLQTVRAEFEKHGSNLTRDGFALFGMPYTGSLRRGRRDDISLRFEAGYDYAMLGVCDSGCGNLDLRLRDAAGVQVDSGTVRHDRPAMRVKPTGQGQFRLQVLMGDCRIAICRYGVGLYQRRSHGARDADAPRRR